MILWNHRCPWENNLHEFHESPIPMNSSIISFNFHKYHPNLISYPRNYVPTNMKYFGCPQTFITTNENDFTLLIYPTCAFVGVSVLSSIQLCICSMGFWSPLRLNGIRNFSYYTPIHCRIWTLIPPICKRNAFVVIPGKITKKLYKIIMSLYHSFEGHTIFH
jgi:hypothetical protein